VMGLALDVDAATVKFYKNGSLVHTVSSLTGTEFYPIVTASATGSTHSVINLGQDDSFAGNKTSGSAGASDANGLGTFYYSPPAGLALCTSNLPDPTIGPGQSSQSNDHFDTVLYVGDGTSSNAISGILQPDWVWIKNRNRSTPSAISHVLQDSVRGIGDNGVNFNTLSSDSSGIQFNQSDADGVSSLNSDGFTVGYTNSYAWNASSDSYVAWCWKAGGAPTATNTETSGAMTSGSVFINGSSTSFTPHSDTTIYPKKISANRAAGFSITLYAGNDATSAKVPHGLSSAPEAIIIKNLQETITGPSWPVGHIGTASDPWTDYFDLEDGGKALDAQTVWYDTAPTSNVVSLGTADSVNSGSEHIMYCFHSVEGFSKVSSYTGGGSNFPFIFTGFRPRWLLIKEVDNTNSWEIYDTARDPDNVASQRLFPNSSQEEATTSPSLDILSNGFKPRASNTGINRSGSTYIYLAFAEAPQKFANAR